jgi:transglutaminase-like putative cysteine protease
MTPATLHLRNWSAATTAIAQVAATSAGMLPWWALPFTLSLTALVARSPAPLDPRRSTIMRNVAVAAVAVFAVSIAFKTVAAGSVGADPVSTLRSLTEALVVLSLVMAPSARTPREYRVWLTVTTGVLVAAAAGGHSATSRALAITSWVVLLIAMRRVQSAAVLADGAVVATCAGSDPSGLTSSFLRRRADVVPVAAALIAAALLFVALPSGLGGGGIARRIAHQVANQNESSPATRSTVGVDTYGDGDLSLLVRGALPDTPLLRVPLNSPSLWRGTFYSTYTGRSWIADQQPNVFTGSASRAVPTSPEDPAPVGSTHTYRAEFASQLHGSLLWSPGVPVKVTGVGGAIQGLARSASNVRLFGTQALSAYDVTSVVATTSPSRLGAARGSETVPSKWTALPAELPTQIGALAHSLTAQAPTEYDKVRAIESYLRTHETYSLNSPVPGIGQDAVYDFLFRDHSGFCEQFASAEAVMLRTLGIPARLVTGLAYGVHSGSTRLYTAANAHAWVEVYYPGIGWSPSDPTKGALATTLSDAHRSLLASVLHKLSAEIPGGRLVLIVVAILLVLGGATIARSALGGRGRSVWARRSREPGIGPVLAAFLHLSNHPRAPAPRAVPETAREYIGRVVAPGQLDSAVATLEQECYGQTAPDVAATEQAVSAFAGVLDA